MADLRNFIIFLTDLLRVALLTCFVIFAVESRAVRNGPTTDRFSEFTAALALAFAWFSLVYFDRRFDVFPWVDLGATSAWANGLFYGLLIVTLVRLWLALRRAP